MNQSPSESNESAAHGNASPLLAPTNGPGIQPAKTLIVSRSVPPGVSGSAHVLAALLAVDGGRSLIAVGGCSPTRKGVPDAANLHLLPTELSLFGRGARFLLPLKAMLTPYAARRIEALAAHERVERIVCVFPDGFYCSAALAAARRLRKPIDFWFHNTFADNRRGPAGWYARHLERSMLGAADRVFFISDALRDRFAAKYPSYAGSFHVLRHPVASVTDGSVAPRVFRSGVVKATLMGNINESNLDATARMLRALSRNPAVRIRMCTPVQRMLLAARGIDLQGVEYLGYLDDASLENLMEDTDLFLLPHGLTGGYSPEEYRTIFPTRAAHYLSRGRPILAHSPAGSGLTRFLTANECAVVVTAPSEEQIGSAFEQLVRDPALQEKVATNALRAARLFHPGEILREISPRGARAENPDERLPDAHLRVS